MKIKELVAELVQIGLKEGNIEVLPGDGSGKVYPAPLNIRTAQCRMDATAISTLPDPKVVVIECPRLDIEQIKRDAQKEIIAHLIQTAQGTEGAEVWRALFGEIFTSLERAK